MYMELSSTKDTGVWQREALPPIHSGEVLR